MNLNFFKFLSVIFSFLFLLPADKTFAGNFVSTADKTSAETRENSLQLPDGEYRIISATNGISRLHVDEDGNVCLRNSDDCLSQLFRIKRKVNGFYSIQCVASGKMLDVSGASTEVGANIWVYSPNATDAQNWIIIKCEDGAYSFFSLCNGLVMDVASGSDEDGTNVRCWEFNSTKAQKFYLVRVQ